MTNQAIAQGPVARLGRIVIRGIEVFLVTLLALMVVAIAWQVFARYALSAPSMYSEEFLRFSLIWLGLLAAGYCFILGRHMNLPLLIEMLPPSPQRVLELVNAQLSLIFGAILIWGGCTSVASNAMMKTAMTQIPVRWLQSVLVICGAMIVGAEAIRMSARIRNGDAGVGQFIKATAILLGSKATTAPLRRMIW